MKKILLLIIALFTLQTFASAQAYTNTSTEYFCNYVNDTIPYGARSAQVVYLHDLLRQNYSYNVPASNFFGTATFRAVKQLQSSMGIARPSGSLGPVTLYNLRNTWCRDNVVINNNNNNSNFNRPIINLIPVSSVGNNVVISWSVQNANTCTLNGINVNPQNGSQSYLTYNETTYTMICNAANGTSNQTSISVKPNNTNTLGPAPTINFFVNPSTFSNGQTVILNWTSNNASSCVLNNQSVNTNGSMSVVAGNTNSYTLQCTGNNQTMSQTLNLISTIINNNNSGYITFGNGGNYAVGNAYNLSWQIPYNTANINTEARGVILDLIDANNGNAVGTINRFTAQNAGNEYRFGNITWTIPKSLRDYRDDVVNCRSVNGENLCGGLIKSGNYYIRATYFTPENACFGFCQQVSGQKILTTQQTNTFYISSPVQ